MPETPKVGLLPLYLALYDQSVPEERPRMEQFRDTIAAALAQRGLEVVPAPVCRVQSEFTAAVRALEQAGVDALVTLHLAYSPSLESAPVLADTRLPLIVLDTTPAFAFGPDQSPDAIMPNHGIHGVQDLCNLLLRYRKPFHIEAGHWEHSDVLDRVAKWALAARLAAALRGARVGRIGEPFPGMGDFAVDPETLRATLGVETFPCAPERIRGLVAEVSDADVAAEVAADRARFAVGAVDAEAHRETVRTCLGVRRWLEAERLSAFTVNFLAVDRASGLATVPFLEASKAMARGIGYAGEGDVLTAALVGALATVYPRTTFTEMFCPDWAGNTIFLSHMGEVNLDLVDGQPELLQKPFPWTDAADPVVAVGRLRGGDAVWVDLAPGPDESYTLIVAPVRMVAVEGEDRFAGSVRGWLRPHQPLATFLQEYSQAGGTHHAALVYDGSAAVIAAFGAMMGWKVCLL
ncbi:MAG: hypothetical protein GX774_15820 [Armatimonadetes bacterium]|nr:hypothetical protein [Armatimonadota bacterium]